MRSNEILFRDLQTSCELAKELPELLEDAAKAMQVYERTNEDLSAEVTRLGILLAQAKAVEPEKEEEKPAPVRLNAEPETFGVWRIIFDRGGSRKICPLCFQNVPIKSHYPYCPYCGKRLKDTEEQDAHT